MRSGASWPGGRSERGVPKIYESKNVLDAAFERLTLIFERFDSVYFAVSGGKDSASWCSWPRSWPRA